MRALRAAAPVVALLVGLTAGCARDHGTAATPVKSGGPSAAPSAASSAAPSGLADMQKKVAAAESALTQADRDAAQDGTGR
ncbi:hypothetical protein [Streptomyces sp. Ru72]|uniref:hypothetical protein n=1 Tax=Streptomyces sp. Ru72 TaxID=2080747 RepID=UPI000CDD5A58|nr:hypothetical protein [Streptomyces sp. Ru72]POX52651.1 hypothetical protein C3488_07995 [Streptomyces sp. Ru72]